MATAELETEAPQAVRCWIEDRRVYVDLADERTISFPASKFSRLAGATSEQLKQVSLRVQGRALRWEALDEDIWAATFWPGDSQSSSGAKNSAYRHLNMKGAFGNEGALRF